MAPGMSKVQVLNQAPHSKPITCASTCSSGSIRMLIFLPQLLTAYQHELVPICHVARSLGLILRRLSHDKLVIDPVLLNQYVTLIFIGTISALSIRAFLKNASRIFSTLTNLRGWFGFGNSAAAAASTGGRALNGSNKGSRQSYFGGASGAVSASSGASLVLMLSELTGVYSISSLLLIRRNVPVKYRAAIDTVLGGELEFQYFHRWACFAFPHTMM